MFTQSSKRKLRPPGGRNESYNIMYDRVGAKKVYNRNRHYSATPVVPPSSSTICQPHLFWGGWLVWHSRCPGFSSPLNPAADLRTAFSSVSDYQGERVISA